MTGRDFRIGDIVEFTGKWAKSQAFPEGTVHQYDFHGMIGSVVGMVGKDLVARRMDELRVKDSKGNLISPGEAYGDAWAPKRQWRLVKRGTGPPAEAWAMPPRSLAKEGDDDIENILQSWASSRGLPPVPPFDYEEFVKSNAFMVEPTKEEWAKVGRGV